jgi:carbamoyltransferase
MERLSVPVDPLAELQELHGSLWEQEAAARFPGAEPELKRRIDQLSSRRYQLISLFEERLGAVLAEHAKKAAASEALRSYSETPGELCDRLLLIDLKIEQGTLSQSDAGIPEEARKQTISKVLELRKLRQHLQVHLCTLLDDLEAGRARLPPRSGLSEALLNEATLHGVAAPPASASPRSGPLLHKSRSIRHVLGIACTGHGASLAYMGADGVVRASVLDRWARTKYTLMLARDEAADIQARATPIDATIHDILSYSFGKFPTYRVFEEAFPEWLTWLLRGLEVKPADIDLVVTSESHFSTCSARLGRSMDRWLPNATVVSDIEHHRIHASQAFWSSGFEEAAVLTLDACGEDLARLGGRKIAGTISRMRRDGTRQVLREFLFPESSPGLMYALVNHHVGFRQGEEGKTMGLAPYGQAELYERLVSALSLRQDGSFEFLSHRDFQRALDRYVPARQPGGEILPEHRNVAYAGQALLEDMVRNSLEAALRLTGEADVAYGGGVALNSVANELARRAAKPRRMYIAPNPSDTGHALGCALIGAYEIAGWDAPRAELPEYLGPRYSQAEIDAAVRASRYVATQSKNPHAVAARCIANGHIVARYGGGAEFGPRALGNRSILGDPRRPDMKDYLNARVKFRESFRPFAPSVQIEHASEWFELEGRNAYMLQVVPVRPERREHVPAIVHVDASARVQTVSREENPEYWELIQAFHELTGVPMVLNTSFNVNSEPIVESPRDAVNCFESTRIDMLLIGGWILSKAPLEELTGRSR